MLDITLYGNEKVYLANLYLKESKPDEYILSMITWQGDIKELAKFSVNTKGEKQTGETYDPYALDGAGDMQ